MGIVRSIISGGIVGGLSAAAGFPPSDWHFWTFIIVNAIALQITI